MSHLYVCYGCESTFCEDDERIETTLAGRSECPLCGDAVQLESEDECGVALDDDCYA